MALAQMTKRQRKKAHKIMLEFLEKPDFSGNIYSAIKNREKKTSYYRRNRLYKRLMFAICAYVRLTHKKEMV